LRPLEGETVHARVPHLEAEGARVVHIAEHGRIPVVQLKDPDGAAADTTAHRPLPKRRAPRRSAALPSFFFLLLLLLLLSRGCEGFIYGRQQRRFRRHLFENRVYGRSHFLELIDIGGV
jgi:hypothetical protein